MKSFRFYSLLMLLFVSCSLPGQGWLRSWEGQFLPYAVQPAPDGGALLLTTDQSSAPEREIMLTKTDADGLLQWQRLVGGPGDDTGRDLVVDDGGGFLYVLGKKSMLPNNGDAWLAQLDWYGNLIWQKTYNYGVLDDPCCLRILPDGGLLLALESDNQLRLVRADANGDELWSQTYPQTAGATIEHLERTADGGFLITLLRSNPPIAAPVSQVLKTDASGTPLFLIERQHFTTYGTTDVARCKPAPNGNLWLAHRDSLHLLAPNGDSLAALQVPSANNLYLSDLWPASDGGLWALATEYGYNPPASRLWLGRIGADLNLVWERRLSIPSYSHSTWAMSRQQDGGFLLTGNYIFSGEYNSYLIRTDSSGRIFANLLNGDIFRDDNNNCQKDAGEAPLAGWYVRITHPNGEIHYATTDSSGHYEAPAGVGNYLVTVLTPNSLWGPVCAQDVSAVFDTTFVSSDVSFPMQAALDCPLPRVDVSMSNWQPCEENQVTVQFSNEGTAVAADAAVTIQLDSLLTLSAASLPFQPTAPFTWQFDLGDLAALQSSAFTLQIVPACDGLVSGQALCIDARITPDAPCLDPLTGPLIEVDGYCSGDTSVVFKVRNKGETMQNTLDFIVIEDNIMFMQGQFQLDAGGETSYEFPANGATWRFEGRQGASIPGWQSEPVVVDVVEACSTDGMFNTGFVNQFSLYDGGSFEEKECREVNVFTSLPAKVAYPGGYESEHYIAANTDIEYALYFVNTGPDTIQWVTLRDTLDAALLAPATVTPGPSSHPCLFSLSDQGVLTFRFDSIGLAPGGQGWVKFRVSQWPDLPAGTLIFNRAWVGFDYQSPEPSNQTWHTVTGSLLAVKSVFSRPADEPPLTLGPVPASNVLAVKSLQPATFQYAVFDPAGQMLRQGQFSGGRGQIAVDTLPQGWYAVVFWQKGRIVQVEKIIIIR